MEDRLLLPSQAKHAGRPKQGLSVEGLMPPPHRPKCHATFEAVYRAANIAGKVASNAFN